MEEHRRSRVEHGKFEMPIKHPSREDEYAVQMGEMGRCRLPAVNDLNRDERHIKIRARVPGWLTWLNS